MKMNGTRESPGCEADCGAGVGEWGGKTKQFWARGKATLHAASDSQHSGHSIEVLCLEQLKNIRKILIGGLGKRLSPD